MNSHLPHPLFLSPALPSEVLQFVINQCTYPTTLIICSDRAEFLSSLTQDILQQQQQQQQQQSHNHHHPSQTKDEAHDAAAQQATASPSHPEHIETALQPPQQKSQPQPQQPPPPLPYSHPPHPLLTCPLAQLAVTRHVRTVFTPTVTHLRAFLSLFPTGPGTGTGTSPPPPPPPPVTTAAQHNPCSKSKSSLLVVYGFLDLHRHTSEWSVQGLGATVAAVVEAGRRSGVGVVLVEGRRGRGFRVISGEGMGEGEDEGAGEAGINGERRLVEGGQDAGEEEGGVGEEEEIIRERVPVLSGSLRRAGGGGVDGSGWAGKTVDVGRVLGRWFRFRSWSRRGGVVVDLSDLHHLPL